MDRKTRYFSFVLILTMLTGLWCGNRTVLAAPSMEVSVSEDLMLTWSDVEGATDYELVLFGEYDGTYRIDTDIELTERPFNLGEYMAAEKKISGSYTARVVAKKPDSSGKLQTFTYKDADFEYTSPYPRLSAPQNLRIEDGKLVWDPCVSPTGSKVWYFIKWSFPSYSASYRTSYDNQIDMAFFHRDGTYIYSFDIVASADDCLTSKHTTAELEYTVDLPAFKNV